MKLYNNFLANSLIISLMWSTSNMSHVRGILISPQHRGLAWCNESNDLEKGLVNLEICRISIFKVD